MAGLKGGENDAQKYASTLTSQLVHDRDGVTMRAGGTAVAYFQINDQNERDLVLMESIAIPLSFAVLVWVLGGMVAAALPIVLGALAIVCTMSVLRLITFATDVSTYALDLSIAMGLALAIDYNLLIISRYREELARADHPEQALLRTMATAGRTVVFSATTVGLSMAVMAVFPMYFLKSSAYTIVATAVVVAVAAVVVTPAAIVLLGPRLDALDAHKLIRRWRPAGQARLDHAHKPVHEQFWYRSTRLVLRHAIPIGMGVVALMLLLGVPFLGVKWGFPDERVLPTVVVGTPSGRHGGQRFRQRAGHRGHRRHSRRRWHQTRRPAALRRGAVPGARRLVGQRARRDLRRRLGGSAARRGYRGGARQRFSYRGHHRAAVLAGLQQPTRPAAQGGDAGRADQWK